MKETVKKYLPSKRKLMQLYFALLFNCNLKGFATGNIYTGTSKQVCVPGINCYSCPGAVGACPLGSLQGAFSAGHSTVYYVCGILALYGVLFGRMICGWLCPFGLIQELAYKLNTPKLKKSPVTRVLSFLKYVILAVFVFLIPILYAFKDTPLPAFCKYICPAGTVEGGLLLLSNKANASYFSMLGPIFTWKFLLMVSIMVSCVFVFRLFCRFLCPLGALYGLFNRFSLFGVQVVDSKCTSCGLCVSHCKVDIRHVGDQECIGCGECVKVCPTKAIEWKRPFARGGEIPDKRRGLTRAVSAAVMLAVLCGAVFHFWTEETPQAEPPVSADRGNQIGDVCYGDSLQIITPDGISEEVLDPTATGTVTVINFWGTWCTPCVNELPYFDQIAREYPDAVTVVAVHSSLGNATAPEYIGKYYADSPIVFATDYALDETGLSGGFYSALGGRGTYPMTLILDENGVITHLYLSSVTYEDLKQAVDSLLP